MCDSCHVWCRGAAFRAATGGVWPLPSGGLAAAPAMGCAALLPPPWALLLRLMVQQVPPSPACLHRLSSSPVFIARLHCLSSSLVSTADCLCPCCEHLAGLRTLCRKTARSSSAVRDLQDNTFACCCRSCTCVTASQHIPLLFGRLPCLSKRRLHAITMRTMMLAEGHANSKGSGLHGRRRECRQVLCGV